MPEHSDDAPLLPGLKPVLELLQSEPQRIDLVFCKKGLRSREALEVQNLCRRNGVRFSLVEQAALDRLCRDARQGRDGVAHQGVVARLAATGFCGLENLLAAVPDAPLPLLLALDQVQDPGNVGTLARTLYALGAAGIVLPRHNSAFLGPGAHRAAAGALERLPMAQVVNLARAVEDAEEAGFATYAARKTPDSLNALTAPLTLPALLVLGNEDKGLRPGVARRCACSLCVPFRRNFDSLNVAQAGGILASCFARAAGDASNR